MSGRRPAGVFGGADPDHPEIYSVANWDNRSTAHLAPVDIFDTDFDRQFYRVTLMGDVPVGPDGSPSTIVQGEPIKPA